MLHILLQPLTALRFFGGPWSFSNNHVCFSKRSSSMSIQQQSLSSRSHWLPQEKPGHWIPPEANVWQQTHSEVHYFCNWLSHFHFSTHAFPSSLVHTLHGKCFYNGVLPHSQLLHSLRCSTSAAKNKLFLVECTEMEFLPEFKHLSLSGFPWKRSASQHTHNKESVS